MKKLRFFLLIFILLGAFVTRLYRFDSPLADWHSWRQADTSAVSRNFIKYGFDILHPRFDDLSNVASGLDNPNGYRFVEFPIYNVFQAGFFKIFGLFTLEEWGRLVAIFSSLASIVFIYLIVERHSNETVAMFSAFFFALLPFNIYYNRTVLPDSSMVMSFLAAIYLFDRWLENKNFQYSSAFGGINFQFALASLFAALAFLLKPYAIFFILPIVYLAFEKFGFALIKKWQLWIFLLVSIAPLIFWRIWMQRYPEGIPAWDWLLNGGEIRFKGAFFYWLFADRIGRLILGYWGILIFGFGLVKRMESRRMLFFASFLFSSLFYLFVVARGNVQHDYYQIPIIPSIAIYLGLGAETLLKASKEYFSKKICLFVLLISTLFMFLFGWYFIRDYFNINNPSIVIAGRAVDQLTPKTAKIIAPYGGDTSLLYQTNRQGWPSFEKDLSEMIKMGAGYLVLINPTGKDFTGVGRFYKVVSATKDYIIFDLSKSL